MLLMTSSLPNHLSAPAPSRHLSGSNQSASADALAFAELSPVRRESARSLDFHSLMAKPGVSKARLASREPPRGEHSARPSDPSRVQPDPPVSETTVLDAADGTKEKGAAQELPPGQVEQAAAFVSALMQVLQPDEPAAPALVPASNLADEPAPFEVSDPPAPFPSPGGKAATLPADAMLPEVPVEASTVGRAEARFFMGADGAIECELPAAQSRKDGESAEARGPSGFELQAELEMAGQPVIRVGFVGKGATEKPHPDRAEKFAVQNPGSSDVRFSGVSARERKIVNVESKLDKSMLPEAGTAIAKGRAAMSTAQHEVISSPRPLGAVADGTALMGVTGEQRMSAPVTPPVVETESASFAERAVATVTGLADAQFSVSMQKAGRVQLRLKFGGEDLSVRIELRDGVVHTDFQSDSPELRSAIMQEWQHVAASAAGRSHTFLDPVFSTGGSALASDAGAQGQSFQRSPHQSQEQSAAHADGWFGRAAFSGRSVLGESFSPEPAVVRQPLQLPTSLRLSALA
jgi:hypothetical protein